MNIRIFFCSLFSILLSGALLAQATKDPGPIPICSGENEPYRDFDFVIGHWDFYNLKGDKIGEQKYTKREQGCLIVEEWTTLTGSTGHGMSFVDPTTNLWRQVWMSPMFHIDYSGSLSENGAMVLKGTMYPNNGQPSSLIKGVWSKQGDGSIKQEFLKFNKQLDTWETFFVGIGRKKLN